MSIKKLKCVIIIELSIMLILFAIGYKDAKLTIKAWIQHEEEKKEEKYIKWVEFNVPADVLKQAYELDITTHEEEIKLNWIELLAYAAAKNGGKFPKGVSKDIKELAAKLINKEADMETLTKDMEYYGYYYEAYSAVLGGFVGEYEVETLSESNSNQKTWTKKYGLKAFSPIAKGFPYSDYNDFGTSRSYGYSRPHLGHDMMGQVGTPIVSVESGYVEAIGWNQYGGWRIGIRSFDKKRYYYYAHLRQNFPYNKELKEGSIVQAGDVIGYMGHTGYSAKENVNNIKQTHLHFGMQLIFDESQKEGSNEIWINCYEIVKLLFKNQSETIKNLETKEWFRVYDIKDPSAEKYKQTVQDKINIGYD